MSSDLFEASAKAFSNLREESPFALLQQFKTQVASSTYEANTWGLIETILQSKESKTLTQLAKLKDWISQISSYDDVEEYELEEQVNAIMAPFIKKPRLTSEVHLSESTCRQQYLKIRANDLRPVDTLSNEFSLANYIINEYININKAILENKESFPCTEMERKLWRESVCQTINNETLGTYGKLLYYALSGNLQNFLNQCQTFEDVIWVYYNHRVEEAIMSSPLQDFYIPDNIASLALSKNQHKNSKQFYYQIQIAILTNKIHGMMDDLYKDYVNQRQGVGLYISDDPIEQEQRLLFISSLILFGFRYLNWEENTSKIGLLSAFISLNTRPQSFRPLAVTVFCSFLSQKNQIELYSTFLEELNDDLDDEELDVLIKMMKKYKLPADDILSKTYDNIFKKIIIKCSNPEGELFKLDFTSEPDQHEQQLIKALRWIMKQHIDYQRGNTLIRYFLSFGKINFVQQTIQILNLKNDVKDPSFKEFLSHLELVKVLRLLEEWNKLKSEELDISYKSNISLHPSKKKILDLESTLSKRLKLILDGAWLDEGSLDNNEISNSYLRQLYVPDLLIGLHKVLYNNQNTEGSQLATYVSCEREILLRDIVAANRLDDVMDELCKSI